ncbi:MAG: response regulator transcription factor, partial [Oscillospiraceae bacterium]|nr:response regulator transcription factor [Oscillospiraceae bacterium]
MNPQIILLVEDDPSIREGVRILLGGEGYMIGEAASGEEALDMMNDTVDLVILDVMLPGMSGIQVCEKIREMTNVPILFLTAKSQETDKALGLLAGGDDYLTKPFSFVELVARVKALLRRYQIYHGKGSQSRQSNSNSLTSGRRQLHTDRNAVKQDGLSL